MVLSRVLLLTMPLAACSNRTPVPMQPLPPAVAVQTATATKRPMPRALDAIGSLVANRKSEVAANAAGAVTATRVERGDVVKAGAPLLLLDSRSAVLTAAEAQAHLRNAKTQLELSNGLCARSELLLRQGAASKEESERLRSQCEQSAGAVETARVRAQLAAKAIHDATVRAPFSGTVSDRYVNVGEYVSPSTTVVTLLELDPLRLRFNVSEAELSHVHPDQPLTFAVEAFPGQPFSAVVTCLDPSVRAATRDLVVEAMVGNPGHKLRPGMFAAVRLQLEDQPMVAIPVEAVRREDGLVRVFAVVDDRVQERVVESGPERDGYVAITQGVSEGDRVVLKPGKDVRDGSPVK